MVVLAGGASSRMGRDKSDLIIEGKTFLEMQIEKGRNWGSAIFFYPATTVKINMNTPLYQTASREKVLWEGWKHAFVKQRIHTAWYLV